MEAENKILTRRKCKRCGYEWWPRVQQPKLCPGCKNRIEPVNANNANDHEDTHSN